MVCHQIFPVVQPQCLPLTGHRKRARSESTQAETSGTNLPGAEGFGDIPSRYHELDKLHARVFNKAYAPMQELWKKAGNEKTLLTCIDVHRLKEVTVFKLTPEFFEMFDKSAEKCGLLDISSCNKTYQGVKYLPGYIYEGTTGEEMVVPSFIVHLLYIFDDMCEEDPFYKASAERPVAFSKELMHVLATGSISQDFLASEIWNEHKPTRSLCAYAEVIHKVLKKRSPSIQWFKHFLSCSANYFFRGVAEVHRLWSQDGKVPSLEEHLSTRVHDGATELAVHIIELQMGVTLSDEVHMFLPFREAKLLAMEHITLNNDLFSYHREVVENKYRYNTLAVMQDLEGFTLEESIDATVRCLNHLTTKFTELKDICNQHFADTSHGTLVDRFMSGLETWMSGYDQFQEHCQRYQKPKKANGTGRMEAEVNGE